MIEDIKKDAVKSAYGKIAESNKGCGCGCSCGEADKFAQTLGYTQQDLSNIPEEANLGLSCGNPISIAKLQKGEVILDLGSGAGFDCFLAAALVGEQGKVIGVDMTPQMIDKAKANAQTNSVDNVDFLLGEIENLPLPDSSVDVVISNCVINLSENKTKVFEEIYRVLKPQGRVVISDIVIKKDLPQSIKNNISAYIGCLAGAVLKEEYQRFAEASGLKDIIITDKGAYGYYIPQADEVDNIDDYAVSIILEGKKHI